MSDSTHPLMKTIPRGVDTKYFDEQTAPQSRFMNPHKVKASADLRYDHKNPGKKILLGKIDDQLIGFEDNRHVLTIAGSRAGKSVTLIGNLHLYPGSVLCTDPKGELAEKSAPERAALGQKVVVLDPFLKVTGPAAEYRGTFNPMKILTPDNPFIIEDALQITDGLVVSSGQEKDPHWNESASHLIMGVILFVALSPSIESSSKNLITVRSYIENALLFKDYPHPEKESETVHLPILLRHVQDCVQHLRGSECEDVAEHMLGAIRGFYNKSTEERGSVLSTAQRHTTFLTFRSMKNVLIEDEKSFDIFDFKNHKPGLSVYLALPATRIGMCNRWLRLMINQFIDSVERNETETKIPILLALDEFPVLGFMQCLQDAAGQVASLGVKMWVILQDMGQGKALYGERFESFAANAGVTICFGNVDVTTTEYISKRLGQTIIQTTRKSEVTPDQKSTGLSGTIVNEQQYPLMTGDEIARTFARDDPQKRQLVMIAGKRIMILERYEYFND